MPSLADTNLLFGIVALQMNFITREQLVRAMNDATTNHRPVGDLLIEHNALNADRRALLEALVQEQLKQHGGDAQQSLAALSPLGGEGRSGHLAPRDDRPLAEPVDHGDAADSFATRAGSTSVSNASASRFHILRPHAEGGLGKVFIARDLELNREVALKEIKERHADNPESRARFVLEAEITGGLEHPGIVPVYGLGAYADGRPYYAMRFIRGDSLKEAIARFHKKETTEETPNTDQRKSSDSSVSSAKSVVDFSGLDFRKLLGRFIDVCSAVAYAHSRGVLHRDLKPGNVMLGKYGETLVVDWGLAKALGERMTRQQGDKVAEEVSACHPVTLSPPHTDTRSPGHDEAPLVPGTASGSAETMAGSAIGSPQFMSPEQAAGRLDLLGPASDVYSLGATLYNLLTGRAPIEDNDIGTVLRRVEKGDFPPPRKFDSRIPKPLEAICLRSMALKPEDRYLSPRDLAEDVERWLADERVLAYPEPLAARAGRWARRHRTLVAAATGLILAAAILLGISTATFRQMHKEADELREKADIALKAGQRSAYNNAIRLAHEHWQDSELKDIPKLLEEAGPPDLRSWEWGYLNHLLHGPVRTLVMPTAVPDRNVDLALSRDGTRIASSCVDNIVVWDIATARELLRVALPDFCSALALSSDSKRLIAVRNNFVFPNAAIEVRAWHIDDKQELPMLRIQKTNDAFAISPDGSRLVSHHRPDGVGRGTVKIWDLASGAELATIETGARISAVSFSDDSEWLAIGGERPPLGENSFIVQVWDTKTAKQVVTLPRQWFIPSALAIDPTKQELAIGSKLVTRWDLMTGKESKQPIWDRTGNLAYSSDGAWLGIAGGGAIELLSRSGKKIWVQEQLVEQFPRTLRGHKGEIGSIRFDRESKHLISAGMGGVINFWDLRKSHDYIYIPQTSTFAFDPAGDTVACGHKDVRFIDAATGHEMQIFKRPFAEMSHTNTIAFDHRGDRLAAGWLNGSITIWHSKSPVPILAKEKAHSVPVGVVAFSPVHQGPLASADWQGVIKVWDQTGRELAVLQGTPVRQLVFSPDGGRLASADHDGVVTLWDLDSRKQWKQIQQKNSVVHALEFAANGNELSLMLGEAEAIVLKRIHLASGNILSERRVQIGQAFAARFTVDRRRLITASHLDQRIYLWDSTTFSTNSASYQPVFELSLLDLPVGGEVTQLALSTNGLTLGAKTGDGLLLFRATPWDESLGNGVPRVKRLVGLDPQLFVPPPPQKGPARPHKADH